MCCSSVSGAVCSATVFLLLGFICQLFSLVSPMWAWLNKGVSSIGLFYACDLKNGQCYNFIEALKNLLEDGKMPAQMIAIYVLAVAGGLFLGIASLAACCGTSKGCRNSCGLITGGVFALLAVGCIVASLALYATYPSTKDVQVLFAGYWVGVPASFFGLVGGISLLQGGCWYGRSEIV